MHIWLNLLRKYTVSFLDSKQMIVLVIERTCVEQVEEQVQFLYLYGFLCSFGIYHEIDKWSYSSLAVPISNLNVLETKAM